MHGANRLGGNSLSDLVVFGRLAGLGAKQYVSSLSSRPRAHDEQINRIYRGATDILNRPEGPNPYLLHEQLQTVMDRYVGIVREAADLETGIAELAKLRALVDRVKAPGASQYNPGWHQALSLRPLLITSEAVSRAALMREESRGAHTRLDFEGERPEWLEYNVVIHKGAADEMIVRKEKRPEAPSELAAIANASIEDLEAGRVGAEVR
jgi:succinate dehydrogenase / fumarate reductase, flavoprotein subunit